MSDMSKVLPIFLILLLSHQLLAQEQEEKFKKNQVKVNAIPLFGGGYERSITQKQSIAIGYNWFRSLPLVINNDRTSHTIWLDYKFHQEQFYIGPYAKYRNSEIFNDGGPCCVVDPLEGTGLFREEVSVGFLFGSQVFSWQNFVVESNIGIGYREFLTERVLSSNLDTDTISQGLSLSRTHLDLRLRVHLGYRF